MKKVISFLLIVSMAFSLCACGKSVSTDTDAVNIADSVTLLTTIWDSYTEDDKFPAGGGDFTTDETTVMDAPGKFGVADGAVLDSMLAFPEAAATRIDDAASLMHMMNANTFTGGVFRAKDGEDVAKLAEDIKKNVDSRQWICGSPEKMLIGTVGNYVVLVFGETSMVDTFKAKALECYSSMKVIYDEDVVISF